MNTASTYRSVTLHAARRLTPWLLTTLAITSAVAQSTTTQSTTLPREPGARWLAVGVLVGDARDPWRAESIRRLRAYARNYPTLRIEILDAGRDVPRQRDQLASMLERRFDAVLISPIDVDALAELIARAASASVPVVLMDRPIQPPQGIRCVVAPDDIQVGRAAAQAALDQWRAAGKSRGTILELTAGDDERSQNISAGLRDALRATPGAELAPPAAANGKQDLAYAVTLDAMKSPPVDLIVAHNDPMARGALLALKSIGQNAAVPVVAIGGLPDEGQRWVRSGELPACVVYPTCGEAALDAALAALSDRPVEKRIAPLVRIINKDNIDRGGKPLRTRGGG